QRLAGLLLDRGARELAGGHVDAGCPGHVDRIAGLHRLAVHGGLRRLGGGDDLFWHVLEPSPARPPGTSVASPETGKSVVSADGLAEVPFEEPGGLVQGLVGSVRLGRYRRPAGYACCAGPAWPGFVPWSSPSRCRMTWRARSRTAGSSVRMNLVSAPSRMACSSKASRSGFSRAGSSCWSIAVAAKAASWAVNPAVMAATRSLTGPGRVPISSAVAAKKQPPGKTRRSR